MARKGFILDKVDVVSWAVWHRREHVFWVVMDVRCEVAMSVDSDNSQVDSVRSKTTERGIL